MNFLQLTYFKEVADLGHVTKASKKLYISQPSLSKSIHLLESELGFPVFDRDGAGITLNKNGQIFYKYCITALDAMNQAISEINDVNHLHPEVTLSIVAATQFLPEIIMGFKKQYPDIKLNINQEPMNSTSLKCDLYIYSSLVPVEAANSYTLLCEECFIGMSVDNPLTEYKIIKPQQLEKQVFLTTKDNLPLYQLTHNICLSAGFEPYTKLQFESKETIFSLLAADMGVSIIPKYTWAPFTDSGKIALRPLSVPCRRYILLRLNESSYMTTATKYLIDFLKNYFAKKII